MIVRRATLADFDTAFPLIQRGLATGDVAFDRDKLAAFVRTLHYSTLAFNGEECVGYIGGHIAEHPFLPRAMFTVMGWYSTHVGAGMRLFRAMHAWAAAQPNIKWILVTVNEDLRLKRVLSRYRVRRGSTSLLLEV